MSELLQFFVSFEVKEEPDWDEYRLLYASGNVIGDKAKYKFRVRYYVTICYHTIQNNNNKPY